MKKCNDNVHASKSHFHNEISIGLIDKGECEVELYGKKYELSEKTILVIPENVVHKCKPKNYEQWNFKMLYINKQWFKSVFSEEINNSEFIFSNLDDNFYSIANEIFRKIEEIKFGLEYEYNLLTQISSLMKLNSYDFCKIKIESIHMEKIKLIKDYINNNYLRNITLDDLSKLVSLSKYYIVKQFEHCYGLTPHQYQINLRINRARDLLKNNDNFTDVALELGFYDQSHFTKYFREYTGLTPMRYIK
ncbi:MAG: AraC family transcriptional regulator [Clostridiaceae bacterium]